MRDMMYGLAQTHVGSLRPGEAILLFTPYLGAGALLRVKELLKVHCAVLGTADRQVAPQPSVA